MTVYELLFPGGFCSPKHETLDSLGVVLGRYSKELAEKRSVPRRVVVYVFVQRFVNPREVKKSGEVEVGSDMSKGLPGNIEEGRSTLWERQRVVVPVKVSMLDCLKGGGFCVLVLIGGVFGSFCGLIEHKLGGSGEHELRSSTR